MRKETGSRTEKRLFSVLASLVLLVGVSSAARPEGDARDAPKDPERLRTSIEECEKLLRADPKNARAHNEMGFCYYSLGEYDNALHAYTKAVRADRGFAVPHNNIGVVKMKRRDYKGAQESFRRAVERDPGYAKAMYNLGVACFRARRYVSAWNCYRKAKKMDAQYVAEREDVGRAEEVIAEQLKESPNDETLRKIAARFERYKHDRATGAAGTGTGGASE